MGPNGRNGSVVDLVAVVDLVSLLGPLRERTLSGRGSFEADGGPGAKFTGSLNI